MKSSEYDMTSMLRDMHLSFEDGWPKVKTVVEKILTLQEVTTETWNESMAIIYNLCVAFPKPLGGKLLEETERLLEQHIKSLYEETKNSVDFISTYDKYWRQYSQGIERLNNVMLHLNVDYVRKKNSEYNEKMRFALRTETLIEINELGLQQWKEHMIKPLGENLSRHLCEAMLKDRSRHCSNETALQSAIQSLITVGEDTVLYAEMFEEHFLAEIERHYKTEVAKEIQRLACSEYVEKVLQWLSAEALRSKKFLHSSSASKVDKICVKKVITDCKVYLQTGCKELILKEARKELQRMYTLLKHTPDGIDLIVPDLLEHITKIGCTVIHRTKNEKPEIFVQGFHQVHKKYLELIQECFNSDPKCVAALDKACFSILKYEGDEDRAKKAYELLVNYFDLILRKKKIKSEEVVEEKLSGAITVFLYLEDKDLFEKLYRRKFAGRLLSNMSESRSAEAFVINKLQSACGNAFVSHYRGIFMDWNLKSSFNAEFLAYLTEVKNVNVGYSPEISIIRTHTWPFSTATETFTLPYQLEKCRNEVEEFYQIKYGSKRTLTWLHYLSTVEVKLCYLQKTYFITMTLYQHSVLQLFEYKDQVTFSEMKGNTNLSDNDLTNVVRSLVESNLILPINYTEACDNVYALNQQYSNSETKVKIPTAARNDEKAKSKKTMQRAERCSRGRPQIFDRDTYCSSHESP